MPAITMKDRQNLSDLAKPIAARIEALGFKWEFDYEYPVPDPDKTQRLQVRDTEHLARPADVNRYAAGLKRGDKFPPGVVTKDGYFVDFNTRAKAAFKLGWPTFPAFVLSVNYATATQFEKEALLLLGAAFNTSHGNRLTRAEQTKIIKVLAKSSDFEPSRVETVLGLTKNTASNIYSQVRAEERAERLNVPFNGSIAASSRTLLGQGSQDMLSDEPWREITRLLQDSGLTGDELRDICRRVAEETAGDAAKMFIISKERSAREAQIAKFKATGKKRPPASSNLRKRLGFILDYESKTGELVDYNPETAREYLTQVSRAVAILRQVERAQSEAISSELPLERV